MKRTMNYLSETLRKKLCYIFDYPLTVIQADSGYGKTTAVSEFFKHRDARNIPSYWYTVQKGTPESAWTCICSLFGRVAPQTAQYLEKCGFPTEETINRIALAIAEMEVSEETVLVIDDYHLTRFYLYEDFIYTLTLHKCSGLHILILTQGTVWDFSKARFHPDIYYLDQREFVFQTEDIGQFFRKNNSNISNIQAEEQLELTGGWPAAVRLSLIYYQQTGVWPPVTVMNELIEYTIWEKLNKNERTLLIRLSLLQSFSESQAMLLAAGKLAAGEVRNVLKFTAFIHYETDADKYNVHQLFCDFLQHQWRGMTVRFQKKALRDAAQACQREGELVKAVLFYISSGYYGKALAQPLNGGERWILIKYHNRQCIELSAKVSEKIFGKYHLPFMQFAIHAATRGQKELFIFLLNRFVAVTSERENCRRLRSEVALLRSFAVYNDTRQMTLFHEEALLYAEGQLPLVTGLEVWTSYWPTVLGMFWKKGESLRETYMWLKRGIKTYTKLADQHGIGSDYVMEADMLLLEGRLEEAEKICNQVMSDEVSGIQDSILFCAEFMLARIALCRGDTSRFQMCLRLLKQHGREGIEVNAMMSEELCTGFLEAVAGREEQIAGWLSDVSAVRSYTCRTVHPFAYIIYAHQSRKVNPDLFARMIGRLTEEAEAMNVLFPVIYFQINKAVYELGQGYTHRAYEQLKTAVVHAFDEQVYVPFAEYYPELKTILNGVYFPEYEAAIFDTIARLGKRINKVRTELIKQKGRNRQTLTPRQREIALLAKERYPTKKIAELLVLSPHTVNTVLKEVYRKLDVHSKGELQGIDF